MIWELTLYIDLNWIAMILQIVELSIQQELQCMNDKANVLRQRLANFSNVLFRSSSLDRGLLIRALLKSFLEFVNGTVPGKSWNRDCDPFQTAFRILAVPKQQ